MDIAIPADFETFAREQVAAGVFASEKDVVAAALTSYLEVVCALRGLIDPAIEEDDRGEGMDGETFMRGLIAEARSRRDG